MKRLIRRDFSFKNLLKNIFIVLIIYVILFLFLKTNIIKISDQVQNRINYAFMFAVFLEVIIVSIYNWFKK